MKTRILALLVAFPLLTRAQHILYSDPEPDDSRRTNFEIIGKVGGNILAFKNNRNQGAISVYGEDMKLISREKLDFLPDKFLNVDFVQYSAYFWMIYEYQKKNTVHCAAVKMDGLGHRLGEPVDLDTTQIGFMASAKIYTTIASEDKKRIMVMKVNSKNPKNYLFTTFLFDENLELIDRHRIAIPMDERNDMFTPFSLDNDGQLVFARFARSSGGDYVNRIFLVTKQAMADTFAIRDVGAGERILDEIKIKVDNNNDRYIITGFYYKQRRGNIEGLYTLVWDKKSNTRIRESLQVFNEEIRSLAKSSESGVKMALNDFFVKNVVVKRDGGYLIIAESEFTTTRGSAFNRWDYMYGFNPYFSPMGYYSPFYNPYSPYNRFGQGNATRYNAENVLIMSFDSASNVEWTNVLPKSQYDDDGDNLISYHTVNTGGAIHFLYNQYERRTLLLTDQSISPDGKLTRYPTLRNLDKGYEFMPRFGKQVGGNQIVIPCLQRNYLCFALIDF